MNIAENKKRTNISEYIIHMYQTEDLIRVYNFDLDLIKQYVIKHMPIDDHEKENHADWYQDIMLKMNDEGVRENGHLNMVQTYVEELTLLMDDLKVSDDEFNKIYHETAPYIEENIKLSEGKINNEVQICLNGIYGLLLARMNGRGVPEEVMPGIQAFGNLLSYLSYKFRDISNEY